MTEQIEKLIFLSMCLITVLKMEEIMEINNINESKLVEMALEARKASYSPTLTLVLELLF